MNGLSMAAGHIRAATSTLLAAETAPLEWGLQALDLQAILEDLQVEPAYVPAGMSAAESLAAAVELLDRDRFSVPLGLWTRLQALVAQVA